MMNPVKDSLWRGSQVVRHGSAKAAFVGSIPTLASSLFVGFLEEKASSFSGIFSDRTTPALFRLN